MKYSLPFLIILLLPLLLLAQQTFPVKGHVVDENGKGVEGATLIIKENSRKPKLMKMVISRFSSQRENTLCSAQALGLRKWKRLSM